MQEKEATRQQLIDELNSLRRRVSNLETINAQLWSIYDSAQVIILAHDVDYRIVYMNPRACQVLGYERDEMIGQPMDGMISELGEAERGTDLRIELQNAPEMVFHGFEQYLRKKDGGVVLIRWDISALRDADGNYAGIVGIGHDITDHRRTEQEARHHREHLGDLVQQLYPDYSGDSVLVCHHRGSYLAGRQVDCNGYSKHVWARRRGFAQEAE